MRTLLIKVLRALPLLLAAALIAPDDVNGGWLALLLVCSVACPPAIAYCAVSGRFAAAVILTLSIAVAGLVYSPWCLAVVCASGLATFGLIVYYARIPRDSGGAVPHYVMAPQDPSPSAG